MSTIQSFADFTDLHSANEEVTNETKAFVCENADTLIQVARAAGGFNAAAAATDLADVLKSGDPKTEDVNDLLVVVRDALCRGSCRIGGGRGTHRPDLDAAVRWYGARLDDLIRDQAQTPTSG